MYTLGYQGGLKTYDDVIAKPHPKIINSPRSIVISTLLCH
jgi:hypothetical protein